MLTKNLTAALLLTLASIPSCFAGFYIGGAAGPEGARFRQVAHVVRPGTINVIDRENFAGVGMFGSLFAGYGWVHQQFYLAGEVNANLSSVHYELSNDEYVHLSFAKTTFTIRNSEGVSLLPGLNLSDNTLFYGRIGYTNGRVKLRDSDPTIQSGTKNCNGVRYGLGIRHHLPKQWTLMMDYSQINYQKIKSFVYEPFGNVTKSTHIYPNSAQVAFGLIYNFDQPYH